MEGIDQTDFDQIFNSWYEPIRNFIYYKSGNMELSEDIAQDTFLRIWERRNDIRKETVRQLLYTTANRLFVNKMDHQKVTFNFIHSFHEDQVTESPQFHLEMNEFHERLQWALATLDDKSRTAFLMNRIDRLTYPEIAGNLGISVKAVEKRMQKALAFLKKEIRLNI
jgi:RNA polymerase sigma-70 factor (ECF subfamily)